MSQHPPIPDPTATAPPWAPYKLDALDLDADLGTMDATPAPAEPTIAAVQPQPESPDLPVYLLAGGVSLMVAGFVLVGLGAGSLVVLVALLFS